MSNSSSEGDGGRFVAGFALCILAGFCNGSWQLPLKHRAPALLRIVQENQCGWQFENAWLVYTALSIIFEIIIAFTVLGPTVLTSIYNSIPGGVIALIVVFSILWGFGSFGFGLAVQLLGIAIGTSLCIGVVMVVGTLLPLFYNNLSEASTYPFALTITGAVVGMIGFAFSAAAGSTAPVAATAAGSIVDTSNSNNAAGAGGTVIEVRRRPQQQQQQQQEDDTDTTDAAAHRLLGVAVAIVGGFMAAQLQFAFVFGQPAIAAAAERGFPPIAASQAVWLFAFTISGSVNLVYAAVELTRNQTWSRFLPASDNSSINKSDNSSLNNSSSRGSSSSHVNDNTTGSSTTSVDTAIRVGSDYSLIQQHQQKQQEGKLSIESFDVEAHTIAATESSPAAVANATATTVRDIDEVPDKQQPSPTASKQQQQQQQQKHLSIQTMLNYTLRNSLLSALMSLLWMSHITIYGYSQSLMGKLGAGIAWPLIMISTVTTGQFWSWLLGEWQDLAPRALLLNKISLLVQLAAVLIIAFGNSI